MDWFDRMQIGTFARFAIPVVAGSYIGKKINPKSGEYGGAALGIALGYLWNKHTPAKVYETSVGELGIFI